MAYELTRDDLIDHLRDQVEFLRLSGAAFDAGYLRESKRLALTLRVLLHHTAKSQSVLEQLGVQQGLAFVDTAAPPFPGNLVPDMGFLAFYDGRYRAPLGKRPPPYLGRTKQFEPWWRDPLIKALSGEEFSRKSVVLGLANKEGGGHVDPKLDEKYARLTRENVLGVMYGSESGPLEPADSPVPYAVRQIAYEVLETIQQLPELGG